MPIFFDPAVDASPVRTFSPRIDSESYRYLRIRIRSLTLASRTITVTVNTGGPKRGGGGTTDLSGSNSLRKHTIVTGAVNTFIICDIDLCSPINHKPGPDEQNSRWSDPSWPPKRIEGPFWGANEIVSLTFDLPTGTEYELDYIKLVRSELPRITASNPDFFLQSSDSGISNGFDTIIADTDGRRSLEVRALGTSATPRTISQGITEANDRNGWTITDDTNPSLWYAPQQYSDFGSARSDLVAFIGASGAIWQGERDGSNNATSVVQWLEAQGSPDGSGFVAVNAQVMAEKIYAGPEMGTILAPGGSTGGAMVLPFAKVLRGQAVGLCYGGGTDVDIVGYGSGTVAADKQYRTGPEYPPNQSPYTYRVRVRGATLPTGISSARRIEHRTPRRFAFDSPVTNRAGNIWIAHTGAGKLLRGEVFSGDLTLTRFRFASGASGIDTSDAVTSLGDVNFASFALDRSMAMRILILLDRTVSGNREVWVGYSDDDGETAGNFTKLANGIKPMPGISARNDQLSIYFKYNSGSSGPGKLYGKYRGAGQSAFGAEFALLDGSGAMITVANENGFSNLAKAPEGPERWLMTLLINGDSAVSEWESSDTGTTWKRI